MTSVHITIMSNLGNPGAMKPGYKTSLCKNFSDDGTCNFGDRCNFAHGTADLRRGIQDHGEKPIFKTSMCRNIMSQGSCNHGQACRFAHSPQELQRPGPGSNFGPNSGSGPNRPQVSNYMVQGSDRCFAIRLLCS